MSENNKPKYKMCPRCELNFIEESEDYCLVCKAELGLVARDVLLPEDDEFANEKLCPVCKINYIREDEDMCSACRRRVWYSGTGIRL